MSSAELPAAMQTATLEYLGLVRGLAIDAYHAGDGVSHTQLEAFRRSPAHYWALHRNPARPIPPLRSGQREGQLLHTLLLEPETFEARYAVGPEAHRNSLTWKYAATEAESLGRELLKPGEHLDAITQVACILADDDRRKLFALGEAEVSAYWRDPATKLLCRCRPDWVHPAGERAVILIDAKTCSDAGPDEFARQVARKGYHRQAAWYSDGYALAADVIVLAFVFVAVEVDYPYAAGAYILDDAGLAQGREENAELLRRLAVCESTDDWPGFAGIEQIELPRWLRRGE